MALQLHPLLRIKTFIPQNELRKLSMSSSQDKKRSAGKPVLPVGENKTGLTPAIPFCEPKVDEDDDDIEMVDIHVMIDPAKGSSDKTNIDVKTFPGIKNLMGAGLEVL